MHFAIFSLQMLGNVNINVNRKVMFKVLVKCLTNCKWKLQSQ